MASSIYYGKSTTAGEIAEKRVRLIDSSFNENTLKEGDMLSVYFTEGLEVDNPTLVLYIGDVNEEISTTNDQGKYIYSTGKNHAKKGDWSDGETVTFTYTSNQGIVNANDNTYYWAIMTHNVRATSGSYGGVLIDAGDDSAASISKVKELIATANGENSLYYEPTFAGDKEDIAWLTLLSIDADGARVGESTVTISIPTFPTIPTSLSDFAEDNAIPLDNATKLGYMDGADFKTIIDLKEGTAPDVRINSPNNIYLTPKISDELNQSGAVIIGDFKSSAIDSTDYALIINKKKVSTEPEIFTVDWSGRVQCADYSGNFKSIFDIFYPVGAYFETTDIEFNPNIAWGGTWTLEEQGQVHISSGTNYAVGTTGGATTSSYTPKGTVGNHKLTVSEIPSHSHVALQRKRTGVDDFLGGSTAEYGAAAATATVSKFSDHTTYSTSSVGGGGNHSHPFTGTAGSIDIMQPYVVVNRWHRIK